MRVYAGPVVGQSTGQRLIRRRSKLESLKRLFPDRIGEFDERIAEIDTSLVSMSCCLRCGRAIKNPATAEKGYGPECLRKSSSESADSLDQGRTP